MLIPTWVIALGFFLASAAKWHRDQYEHALARLLVSSWYLLLSIPAVYIYLDQEDRQIVGRWLFFLLSTTEILSYILRAWSAKILASIWEAWEHFTQGGS